MFSQSFQPVLRIHIFGVDPDPDPRIDASDWWIRIRIFITDLQDANKKIIVLKKIFCLLLFEATFASFFKDYSRDKGFSYNFCLMIKGSGSRRSQKIRIPGVRIRNTDLPLLQTFAFSTQRYLRVRYGLTQVGVCPFCIVSWVGFQRQAGHHIHPSSLQPYLWRAKAHLF